MYWSLPSPLLSGTSSIALVGLIQQKICMELQEECCITGLAVVSDYGAAQQLHPFGRSWEKCAEQELGEHEMPQL